MAKYAAPGQPGSIVSYQPRYDNWIGGECVAAGQGPVLREPLAGQRPGRSAEVARGTAEDVELALDAAHAAAPAWGKTVGGRARQHPQQDRRPDRGEPREARRRRDAGTTASRSARPWPPTSRWPIDHFRYFAGAIRAQEGSLSRDRRGHRRLPLPRAARRRRADHPVELPDPDGDLEARPGAGRRQRGRAQAGRADPGVDHAADGAHRRPAAAGRAQHRQRLRRRGRQAAGLVQAGSARSPSPARPPPAG